MSLTWKIKHIESYGANSERLPCIRRKTVRRTVSVTKTGNASDYEK